MNKVIIDASNLTCSFDHQPTSLFTNLSLLLTDTTYFLVGRNGNGKSALAAMLSKPSDNVKHLGSVGYLAQGLDAFSGRVAQKLGVDHYLQALARIEKGMINQEDYNLLENKWDIRAMLQKKLEVYGLPENIVDVPYCQLSGGERTRISLLALDLQENDFYILDEPSNHLDAKGRKWLLSWMEAHPSSLIISHDFLLLKQSKIILELTGLGLKTYRGGWEDYRASKKQAELHAERQVAQAEKTYKDTVKAKQQAQEKTESNAAKGGTKKINTNQSKLILNKQKEQSETTKSRLLSQSQQKIEEASKKYGQTKETLEITKPQAFIVADVEEGKKKPLVVHDLTLPYGATQSLSFTLPYGEHLWVCGDNGKGKSTLFKILMGGVEPLAGSFLTTNSIAMLDQHFSCLDETKSGADNFETISPGMSKEKYRTILAQIRLRREAALVPVKYLSGGERLKLALACLFSGNYSPALLLLDEPDNHLDFDSKALLIAALKQYKGSMLIVSHDESFIQAIGIQRILEL